MKRAITAVAVLMFLSLAAPAFAASRTVLIVDDVIKMSKAGVGEAEIIAFVHKSSEQFDVSADDVIAMSDAQVPRAVIKAVVDEAAAHKGDRDRERRYVSPRVVVGPYWYDPFYYDPFWYGPRVSLGFGIGPRWGYGHYGHRGRHR